MKYRVMNPTRIVQNIFRRLSTSDTRFAPLTTTHLQVSVPKTIEGENITQNIRSHPPLVTAISVRTMSSEPNGGASCSKSSSHKNRLAKEKSPYLLQHATNPVDWYPWGEEAFEKARKEKKLIFLSVGYSTCHWCHVMEHESFENEEVAEIMNKYYVNIKVDREERPDIDKMYMSFIQATSGSGGWPMSVFLTPTLEPITGGTYFPPEDRWGTPGFKTVLQVIADRWNTDPGKVENSGKNILSVLRKVAEKEMDGFATVPPGGESVQKCVQQFHKSYEHEFGGFSRAPKFPQPSNFNFLFHVYSRNMESPIGKQCLNMCLHSLKCMALGGIHDHVSSGFARYSTDSKWHVPHFEKMLYDQGQLAVSYSDAYIATKDKFYAEIVRDILLYVSRDLSHPEGGFYSAEDADSFPDEIATHKAEGAFCVWEFEEINQYLTEKLENIDHSEIFRYHFNVKENGNVNPSNDPHGELLNKNVLIVYGGIERTAQFFNLPVEKVKEVIEKSLKILYEVRQSRPRPELDSKILTAWNGLMISGFAKSGYALKDDSYVQRALQAANFIKKNLYNEKNATLLRCCYRGSSGQIEQIGVPIAGFLDDYAFLIRGLLDLYEASLDATWLDWAEKLQDTQDRLFWDETHGGYFTSAAGDPSVLIRIKEEQDGAEPSGNSVSAQNLLRLGAYLDRGDFKAKAEKVLVAFAERLQNLPIALPEMMSALMLYQDSPTQICIVGTRTDPSTEALMDVVRTRILPGRLLILADGPNGSNGFLYQRLEILKKLKPQGEKATAYVCHHHACSLPVTDPQELFNLLEEDLRMQHRQ